MKKINESPNMLPKINEPIMDYNKDFTNTGNKNIENFKRILEYFETNNEEEEMIKGICNVRNPNSTNLITKLKSIKTHLKNPSEIIDEVKAKYDFNLKLKDINGPKNSNREKKFGLESFAQTDENIRKFYNSNKKSTQRKISIREFEKGRETMKNYGNSMKITELANLVSQNKNFENYLLRNFIHTCKQDMNIYEILKIFFRVDSDKINSENKQIQIFLIMLDKLISNIIHSEENNIKNNKILNSKDVEVLLLQLNQYRGHISLMDSLFIDFCLHLSVSSNFRAEFLQKLWKEKNKTFEDGENCYKNAISILKEEIKNLRTENSNLKETNLKLGKEKDDYFTLSTYNRKELDKAQIRLTEREKKIVDLNETVISIERDLEEKNKNYSDLMNKFNQRLNPGVRKTLLQSNLQNNDKQADSHFLNTNNEPIVIQENDEDDFTDRNNQSPVLKKKESKSTKNIELISMSHNQQAAANNKISDVMEKMNIDMNDLIKTRQKRTAIVTNPSFRMKMNEKKILENFNQRKQLILEDSVLNMEKTRLNDLYINNSNSTEKAKRHMQFQLYLNKGIHLEHDNFRDMEVQTDISSFTINNLLSDKYKLLENNSETMKLHVKILQESFNKIKKIVEYSNPGKENIEEHMESVETIHQNLFQSNNNLLTNIKQFLEECELLMKDNENLRETIVKQSEANDNIKETYSEIFQTFVKNISENNEEMHKFLFDSKNQKVDEEKLFEFLNKLIEKNASIIDKDKDIIFSVIPHIDVKQGLIKTEYVFNLGNMNNRSFEFNSIKRAAVTKDLLLEFASVQNKIKLNLNWKKTIKIIDTIYFEWLERIYFKKDKLNFDTEENYMAFSEIPFIYFNHHFGLESLAKKKFFEFLQALSSHMAIHKRIGLFYKLMQLNHFDSQKFYDVFVTRQLILMIQQLKVHNCTVKSNNVTDDENEKTKIGLYYNKAPDVVYGLIQKLPSHLEIKNKIQNYIEKNKSFLTINMRKEIIFDFDQFIDVYAVMITELESHYVKYLRIIFNAIDIEKKSYFTPLDFFISRQYLLQKNNSYETVKTAFEKFADNSNNIKFEQFETIAIESDLFDDKIFLDYLKITDVEIRPILKNISDELKESSLNIIDCIKKRLIIMKDDPLVTTLIYKVICLSERIFVLDEKEDVLELWLSLKLLDDVSLAIYNEIRVFNVFRNLSEICKIMDDNNERNKKENLVLKYINII